jgi:hypothetical protein
MDNTEHCRAKVSKQASASRRCVDRESTWVHASCVGIACPRALEARCTHAASAAGLWAALGATAGQLKVEHCINLKGREEEREQCRQ